MGRIIRHGIVDSSSQRAFAAIAAGSARDGDVHVARGQTAGRGRQGRRWESPTDAGLYLSLVHLPPAPGPSPAALTVAAGLAVLDALRELGLEGARLEWPNDVVVGGAKLAGILVESRQLDPARPHYVVGIGVNVRQTDFPRELEAERAVTSLARIGHTAVSPDELLDRLLGLLSRRLEQALSRPRELGPDFLAATGLAGAEVVATVGGTEYRGCLETLDLDRGLVLRPAHGSRIRLELAHIRALDPAPASL